MAKIAASTGKAKKWFADIKPDVVVGFGGYVCIPVARAAEKTGVPWCCTSRILWRVWQTSTWPGGPDAVA